MQIVVDEGTVRAQRLRIALCWAVVPYIILGYFYIICPGYLIPFFHHPIASAFMLLALTWQKIGVVIQDRMGSSPWQAAVILIFYAPMLMLPFMGPSFTSIVICMGPVLR